MSEDLSRSQPSLPGTECLDNPLVITRSGTARLTYRQMMAALLWTWWHGGERLPSNIIQANRSWVSLYDLEEALLAFENQKAIPASEEILLPVPSENSVFEEMDPIRGREAAYMALQWNHSLDDKISWAEVDAHVRSFYLYLLIFAASAYACRHPGELLPLCLENIWGISEEINAGMNGAPTDETFSDIAWRMLPLTPEGLCLQEILRGDTVNLPAFQEFLGLALPRREDA